MAFTNEGIQEMFEHGLFKGTRYLALFIGDTEVSGNGYARKSTTASDWTIENNYAYNTAQIDFNDSTGNWGDITEVRLMTASSDGDSLFEVDLSNDPNAVTQDGINVYIPAGNASSPRIKIPLS